jgi:SAM-dependent methyltransferase
MMEIYTENPKSYRTAIRRGKMSAPTRWLMEEGYLELEKTILDFGCGKGDDVRTLTEEGFDVTGYDLHHEPFKHYPTGDYDTVICNYVLNVSKDDHEMRAMIAEIYSFIKNGGEAFISVRRDILPKNYGQQRTGAWQRNVFPETFEHIGKYFELLHSHPSREIYRFKYDADLR